LPELLQSVDVAHFYTHNAALLARRSLGRLPYGRDAGLDQRAE